MAVASIITRILVDDPSIYHGFWHSYGTSFPRGPVLTVNTSVFAFLTSAIALYIAWVILRAWRILDALIFKSIYERTKTSLQESQCAALLANSKTPLPALIAASQLLRRGGPKNTLTKIIWAAIFTVALNAIIPLLVASFPAYNEGLIASEDCGYSGRSDDSVDSNFAVKTIRFADASLLSADQSNDSSTMESKTTTLTPLPNRTQSYVRSCPRGATCHPDYPFTFLSTYTLTSRHLGLNIGIPFSLQISDMCYRPIQAIAQISRNPDPVAFGLFYGHTIDLSTGIVNNWTDAVFDAQRFAPGYSLRWNFALTGSSPNVWTPNTTLVLGGDTIIFFYFIGSVYQRQPSDDPIFATNGTESIPEAQFYPSRNLVSPVVCDTKYQFCVENGRQCSPTGPSSDVLHWVNRMTTDALWNDLSIFLSSTTSIPPMFFAALGSGSIASSKTLVGGLIQTDSEHNNVAAELGRLSQAGMAILASSSQLAALGYWNEGYGSQATPSHRICRNVIIQTPNAVSILLKPYLVFFSISIVIVAVSYAEVLGARKLELWRKYADPWALYFAGQLHREVAEQICGEMGDGHAGETWPDLRQGHGGLEVVDKKYAKYFASAIPPPVPAKDWLEPPPLQNQSFRYASANLSFAGWPADTESSSLIPMPISNHRRANNSSVLPSPAYSRLPPQNSHPLLDSSTPRRVATHVFGSRSHFVPDDQEQRYFSDPTYVNNQLPASSHAGGYPSSASVSPFAGDLLYNPYDPR